VVKQVSCPALLADPAPLTDSLAENRLVAPGALRAQAYALYLSLAREFAPEGVWPIDSLMVRDPAGRPVPGAFVTLGGALVLETDAEGRVRFARTEPGPLAAEVHDRRVSAKSVLLDSMRGAVLAGPGGH
jgi:hypothetical protein